MPRLIEFPAEKCNTYDYRTGERTSDVTRGGSQYPVATEEELLSFANAVREAGGAEVIEALLPSTIQEPETCLIANALNFKSSIVPEGEILASTDYRSKYGHRQLWYMEFAPNTDVQFAMKIASLIRKLDFDSTLDNGTCVEITPNTYNDQYSIRVGPLPAHIGNAADAFDNGLAFQEYDKDRDE